MLAFSLVAGLAFGAISAGSMIKIAAPSPREKRDAMAAAFLERFFTGFAIGPVARGFGANGLLIGALLGIGFSVPTALTTRVYLPIVAMGTVGGLAVGLAYVLVY